MVTCPLFFAIWSSVTPASHMGFNFIFLKQCKAGTLSHPCGFEPSLLSTCLEALGTQVTSLSFGSPSEMMGMTGSAQESCEDN